MLAQPVHVHGFRKCAANRCSGELHTVVNNVLA